MTFTDLSLPPDLPAATRDLTELVRSLYLDRGDGVIEIEHPSGVESLFFRRGELHLDRDHPAAARLSPFLAELPEGRPPAASPELRREVVELAREIHGLGGKAVLKDARSMVVETIGPLPAVWLVQELAVAGCNEGDLFARLGGETAKLESAGETPALDQLPGLDPDMSRMLVGLEKPSTPAQLMRGSGGDRLQLLRALVRLWAVGLVVRANGGDGVALREEILQPKLLASFTQRIEQSLAGSPLELTAEEHRRKVAELLGRLGEMNHYELLGIELDAAEEQIFAAYNALARRVHPSHSRRLGLEGKEDVLRVLFEKATEAYLTLSDPRRRASYNTVVGIRVDVLIDADQRREEKRKIALQNYRRATTCLTQMDYSLAVELLKEAARMDPRAEYFALLGQAQSKNPHWQSHALGSFERAIELDPDDAGYRYSFGKLLEEMDRMDDAREQYAIALDLRPDHPEAGDALERLGGRRSVARQLSSKTGNFRSLFGKPAKE